MGRAMHRAVLAASAMGAFLAAPGEAAAHAADRGFVMLLPTGYYLAGGAVAVALSFVVLALVPAGPVDRLARRRLSVAEIGSGERWRMATSLASLAFLAFILVAGFAGSRDPLSNPLPLIIWTVWWVGLTIVQGLAGNLWRWLDPWWGAWCLACLASGRDPATPGPLRLPRRLAYWPAIALFVGFAWFELVDLAPDDPARLATAVGIYWTFTMAMVLLFGHRSWTARGECFSIFFAMIARMAVLQPAGRRVALAAPGAGLATAPPLPPAGVLFLLLALSTVSFDGLMRTFFWFGLHGLNPLEFAGRSSVTTINTAGLLGMFALLAGAFLGAVWAGGRLIGAGVAFRLAAGRLVWSIIPISLAYHLAHYVAALMVDGQYALAALSDPLARGWNLFGTAGMHVSAGITVGYESSWWIWNVQAGAIILGHVLAVAAAHVIAHRLYATPRSAALSHAPLAVLMVLYTVFGLWLLASPTGM